MLVQRPAANGLEPTTILIDTAPELRLQTSAAGVRHLDAALLTHDHADQTHGIDDLRAFALSRQRRTPCYMDAATERSLMQRFGYIFEGVGGYPAICDLRRLPEHGVIWAVPGPSGDIPVVTFDQDHGGIRSVGYRFGDVAYSSDVVDLPPEAFEALKGLKVWIVDALRYRAHPTHAHLAKTLDWIAAVKPERAILTNLHVDMDYATLASELPEGVEPAYDGMSFDVALTLSVDRLRRE
jgi:phosphoribosyl 1,2-cyclic phosphate phosphodiesterase